MAKKVLLEMLEFLTFFLIAIMPISILKDVLFRDIKMKTLYRSMKIFIRNKGEISFNHILADEMKIEVIKEIKVEEKVFTFGKTVIKQGERIKIQFDYGEFEGYFIGLKKSAAKGYSKHICVFIDDDLVIQPIEIVKNIMVEEIV